jgi:probable RNA-binding protein EIF1AD
MSGAKRRTGHRKHVTESALYELVEPTPQQKIALVLKAQGSNLFELYIENGDIGLAMLPTKFRKLLWLKRGDFVFVSESSADFTTAAGTAGRVRYMIDAILYPDQIKHLKSASYTAGKWPSQLDDKKKELEDADKVGGTAAGAGSGGAAEGEEDGSEDDEAAPGGEAGAGKRSVVTFAASATTGHSAGGGPKLPALKSNVKPTKANAKLAPHETEATSSGSTGIMLSSASALGTGSGQALEGIKWTANGDGPRTVDGGAIRCLDLFTRLRHEAALIGQNGVDAALSGNQQQGQQGEGHGAAAEEDDDHHQEEADEDEGSEIMKGGREANKRFGVAKGAT